MRPVLLLLIGAVACTPRPPADVGPPEWVKLDTEPARDRQDDISLIDSETGWYVNSLGRIFKTGNGGRSWSRLADRKGTYWRTIHFIDAKRGFAGNLGPGAVEGFRTVMTSAEFRNLDEDAAITDPTLIYETRDGGLTWSPAAGVPPGPGGICSMSSIRDSSGRWIVFAGGRVTGPARLFRWTEGTGWESIDLAGRCGMVLDVVFLDARNGVVCAATAADPATSFASILRTGDGGRTWAEVYRSSRPGESVWKCSFPTPNVGYATIRPFLQDSRATLRYVLKTVDGGRTWKELLLIDDFDARPQGIGFLTPDRGWVGTTTSGFETLDGGESWARVNMGRSINRIRILPAPGGGHAVYAIGQDLFKIELR